MRVMLLTWEYPPRIVGKLSDYVNTIALQLQRNHVETYIVTYHDTMTGATKEPSGIQVARVANPLSSHTSLLTWVLTLNQEIERAAANIYYKANGHVDLIDVYDWHFVPAAVTLKNSFGIPLIYSVDSLEDHRSPGSNTPLNMAIRGIEWLGFYEASKVIVKTEWMQSEIIRIYKVPKDKITVVPPTDTAIKSLIKLYKSAITGGKTKLEPPT